MLLLFVFLHSTLPVGAAGKRAPPLRLLSCAYSMQPSWARSPGPPVLHAVCTLVLCSRWPGDCLPSSPSHPLSSPASSPPPHPTPSQELSLQGDVSTSPLKSHDTHHSVPSIATRSLYGYRRLPYLRVSSTCSVGSSQVHSECLMGQPRWLACIEMLCSLAALGAEPAPVATKLPTHSQ